jgi:ubiquinone/menaquinone biosynthesis C-methylase UbiE
MSNDTRRNYWNEEYVDYWKRRVERTNKSSVTGNSLASDPTTTDDLYFQLIRMLNIHNNETILEVGCGFGRSLLFLSFLAHSVIAVDISNEMIKEAKDFTKKANNIKFMLSESEKMDIELNSVDKIICFAAFDAMYQKEALFEFNRVCKKGGKLLITGKNDNYLKDDSESITAEKAARGKGHPNYFTDVRTLFDNIYSFGFELEYVEYYERRGDFANRIFSNKMPLNFYEYFVIFKKTKLAIALSDLPDISDKYSKTYKYSVGGSLK